MNLTAHLQGVICFYGLGLDFQVQRNILSPAEQILVCANDFSEGEYVKIIDFYHPLRGKSVEMHVMALTADSTCVARLTNTFTCAEEMVEEYSFPNDIVSPVVVGLKNDEVAKRPKALRETGFILEMLKFSCPSRSRLYASYNSNSELGNVILKNTIHFSLGNS